MKHGINQPSKAALRFSFPIQCAWDNWRIWNPPLRGTILYCQRIGFLHIYFIFILSYIISAVGRGLAPAETYGIIKLIGGRQAPALRICVWCFYCHRGAHNTIFPLLTPGNSGIPKSRFQIKKCLFFPQDEAVDFQSAALTERCALTHSIRSFFA